MTSSENNSLEIIALGIMLDMGVFDHGRTVYEKCAPVVANMLVFTSVDLNYSRWVRWNAVLVANFLYSPSEYEMKIDILRKVGLFLSRDDLTIDEI
jgi:hypothetical protein